MNIRHYGIVLLMVASMTACGRKDPEPAKQQVVVQQEEPKAPANARWMLAGQIPGYTAERWYASDEPHVVDGFVVFHDATDEKIVKLPAQLIGIYEQ